TSERLPDAFVAYLQDWRRRRAALYMYDPAGESYRERKTLLGQNYQKIISGMLFLIDPYSVRGFILDYPDRVTPLRFRPEATEAVYARQIAALRQTRDARNRFENVAIAVVVTKADELSTDCGNAREWLDRFGQGNLIRTVESDFSTVRYFFTSINPANATN